MMFSASAGGGECGSFSNRKNVCTREEEQKRERETKKERFLKNETTNLRHVAAEVILRRWDVRDPFSRRRSRGRGRLELYAEEHFFFDARRERESGRKKISERKQNSKDTP